MKRSKFGQFSVTNFIFDWYFVSYFPDSIVVIEDDKVQKNEAILYGGRNKDI